MTLTAGSVPGQRRAPSVGWFAARTETPHPRTPDYPLKCPSNPLPILLLDLPLKLLYPPCPSDSLQHIAVGEGIVPTPQNVVPTVTVSQLKLKIIALHIGNLEHNPKVCGASLLWRTIRSYVHPLQQLSAAVVTRIPDPKTATLISPSVKKAKKSVFSSLIPLSFIPW